VTRGYNKVTRGVGNTSYQKEKSPFQVCYLKMIQQSLFTRYDLQKVTPQAVIHCKEWKMNRNLDKNCNILQKGKLKILNHWVYIYIWLKYRGNSVGLVRKRTILTEQPQPVGEVSANFS
jgi:hypothetical protein